VPRTQAKYRKKKIMKGHCEVLIWNVPIELKLRFKAKCVAKNVTMRDTIIRLMNNYAK